MKISEEMMALLTIMRHREFVSEGLIEVSNEFSKRARRHDRSKLMADEFEGYARITEAGRKYEFDSPERERLRQEPCIVLHKSRNAHHPEYHPAAREMGEVQSLQSEKGFL